MLLQHTILINKLVAIKLTLNEGGNLEKQIVLQECNLCGFTWERGTDGHHSCSEVLRKQLKIIEERLSGVEHIVAATVSQRHIDSF